MGDAWTGGDALAAAGAGSVPSPAKCPRSGHGHWAPPSCCWFPTKPKATGIPALHSVCGSTLSEAEAALGARLESANAERWDQPGLQ